MPPWVASLFAGGLLLVTYGLFAWAGSAVLVVADGELRAGRAHIETRLLGPAEALDAAETRRVHGVDADARAFLLTRPYLKRAGAGAACSTRPTPRRTGCSPRVAPGRSPPRWQGSGGRPGAWP